MTPRRPLAVHVGLAEGSRVRWLASSEQRAAAWELAFLASCGVAAAGASVYLDLHLRIPGHAILRAIFPMVLGMALVPRSGAGTVMGASALLTGVAVRFLNPAAGLSLGALASLSLVGPLLDLCVDRMRGGWPLYLGFATAGLMANLVALFVRAGAKLLGFERLGTRPFSDWFFQACVTYVVCGLLAGLISGVIWFHATRRRNGTGDDGSQRRGGLKAAGPGGDG
ncbi:MAG: hypothetical protein ACYC6Y_01680 [Thermoguttaceae bacterium]